MTIEASREIGPTAEASVTINKPSSTKSSSLNTQHLQTDEEIEETAAAIVNQSATVPNPGPGLLLPSPIGSTPCLPDMSATLNAKVTVTPQQQADPRLLSKVYDDMALKFTTTGLNLEAISQMQQYFTSLDGPGHAVPLEYANFPVPLPPSAVRLAVVFFQECNKKLGEMLHAASAAIMAALPDDFKIHLNRPSHYHITVYMTSQPHTLRPDPFNIETGGLPPGYPSSEEIAAVANPLPEVLEREINAMKQAAFTTPAPKFEVHRIVFADSGTLLLCSVDKTGHLAGLRSRLRGAFPGGPPRQSTIVHASLARCLTPRQLTQDEIGRVQEVCGAWSEKVRGMEFHPEHIYHIQEETFTTVEGPRVRLPFQGYINK